MDALTGAAIAKIAFDEFVKSGAGEVAKKAVGGAIEQLRSIIKSRFKGKSPKAQVLDWLGFSESQPAIVEVIVSEELTDQISRVSKRVKNKDWGSKLLARIWQKLNVRYVLLNLQDFSKLKAMGVIPREDIGVYLTAKAGQAQCFVSSNHKLVRALASSTGGFECLTPEEFAKK